MNYVIKIKFEDTLRRLTYPGNRPYGDEAGDKLTFEKLEGKIRSLFKIPASSAIRVTYIDRDNDVITMGDDQDLEDACVLQGLNPLRLTVTVVEGKRQEFAQTQQEQQTSTRGPKDVLTNLKEAMKGLPSDVVKPVIEHAQQLVKLPLASPRQLTELVDTVVLAVTSHIDSSVQKGHVGSPTPNKDVSLPNIELKVPTMGQPVVRSPVHRSVVDHNAAVTAGIPFGISGTGPFKPFQDTPAPVPVKHQREVTGGAPGHRGFSDNEAAELGNACRVFHSGVQCDLCGMNPIVGPRFKSNKKHDYDLCDGCYRSCGNENDYQRIDRPLFRPRHLRCSALNPNLHAPRGPLFVRPRMHPSTAGKLDARFVQDVTIFDGTELAPLAKFTKIWRLRNSGTLPWPLDTKLVHVGGDELGNVDQVPVELPGKGLAPGDEVDVSVDLVAPEKPGRYVSHWRLASPAGPKFGHRVWVLIQVVSNEKFEDGVSHELSPPLPEETMVVVPDGKCQDGLILEMSALPLFESARNEGVISRSKSKDGADNAGVLSEHALFLADFYPQGFSSSNTTVNQTKEGFAERQFEQTEKDSIYVETVEQEQERSDGMEGSKDKDVAIQDTVQLEFVKGDFPPEEEKVTAQEELVVKSAPSSHKTTSVGTDTSSVEDVSAFVNSELGMFSLVDMPPLVSSPSSGTVASTTSVEKNPELKSVSRSSSSADTPADSAIKAEEKELSSDAALADKDLGILSLCEELERMGFNDRKLNVQLLEKNNLDLRRTVDEYLYAAEWDPILEELEEMGFYDVEMNRRLMFKNNGSVKRVVKELVQMYKEPAGVAQDKGKGKLGA
ncbi:hypothetical protein R1sor_007269 [Riccia sorocarpa]|uniref:ZZ-type domain-containing protein n=1 Tax=Riccia sorocarpa TaxID=122646 RepID=A0ABD3HPY8_9MARC